MDDALNVAWPGHTNTESPGLLEELVLVGGERATGVSGDSGGTLRPDPLEGAEQVQTLASSGVSSGRNELC